MADINFNTVSVVSAINDSDYLHITTGNSHRRVLVSKLIEKAKSETLNSTEAAMLDKLTSGLRIMYHRKLDNVAVSCTASSWTTLQNNGEVADGVMLVEGGRHIVIAPTESGSQLPWASASVAVGSAISDRISALSDFSGKERTSAIISNATIGGDGSGYAAGFCNSYSRSNGVTYGDYKDTYGMYAGRWWLPSLGEMLMILGRAESVNMCMSIIGGTPLKTTNGAYWASTEGSSNTAWYLYPSLQTGNKDKATGSYYVRPVSAFYL